MLCTEHDILKRGLLTQQYNRSFNVCLEVVSSSSTRKTKLFGIPKGVIMETAIKPKCVV